LGHFSSRNGIEVDPDKVQAVRDFSAPRNTTEVSALHGLCKYFCRFVPNFGKISKAFTDFYKDDAKVRWTDIQQLASDHLKSLLCVDPVLAFSDLNVFLATDASVWP
jgi:accessory colonization factor AcfC